MDNLRSLHFRKLRIIAMIDILNELASSAPSDQRNVKIDVVSALEELRAELIEVQAEIKVLIEARQACLSTQKFS